MAQKIILVFVHGYSVTNTDTYGELPLRLREEGKINGIEIEVEEIFLGSYISFHDEVKLNDVSRALQTAIKDQLPDFLNGNKRFVCITHSTGAPVVRNWWNSYYNNADVVCPMSHLIMLAPANYGSALAQLGKGKLSRMKSWFNGVEPGQGILDWLELGSSQAWDLNKSWIHSDGKQISEKGIFPFVLTGQSIDRKFYDNLNSYTGELGSDGVVRAAAANMNGRFVRLRQDKNNWSKLNLETYIEAPNTAFSILSNKSHSDVDMGIMNSVKKDISDSKSAETVKQILACIKVNNLASYQELAKEFEFSTNKVQSEELIEFEKRILNDRYFIHDRYTQVIFRLIDAEGIAITDFDLVLTAGSESDPNLLPEGFFVDRQRNKCNKEAVTYYFNYDVMKGCSAVISKEGKNIRSEQKGNNLLGIQIRPRPDVGFVKYAPCEIRASEEVFNKILQPNSTCLVEIILERIVSKETFMLEKVKNNTMPTDGDFSKRKPSNDVVD